MNTISELMKSRRSIRKFTDEPVSNDIIRELIEAAVTAPSGCNSQCWYFAVFTSKDKIAELALAAEKGVRRFYNDCDDELFLSQRIKQTTFFRNAPAVICVFLTRMDYHDKRVEEFYNSKGFDHHKMLDMLGNPDILSVGAAVENLILKAHESGLGACWMNDPAVAAPEISDLVKVPDSYRFLSLIPVGKPAYIPHHKQLKPLDDVIKFM